MEQHGRYSAQEAMMRYEGDMSMSQGMEIDVMEAAAYAQGQLAPLSNDETRAEFHADLADSLRAGSEPDKRELHFRHKLMTLKSAPLDETTAIAIGEATRLLHYLHDTEKRYRRAHAMLAGWQIEIIGDMPKEIGMCRYVGEAAA